MTIHLRPELEALVKEDVERGPTSPLMNLSLRRFKCYMNTNNGWLINRADIAAKIERGFGQAERGELVDVEEAFLQLRQRHDEYRKQR